MTERAAKCVSNVIKFLGRHKLEAALGGVSLGCMAVCCVMEKKAREDYGKTVSAEIVNTYEPFKEFMAGMETVIRENRRIGLKRELTKEEIDEIERRIFFEQQSMEEVLTEMNLRR